jgi:hypothetical protein
MPFIPEPRAAGRQKFCRRAACREVSHVTSQEDWLKSKKGRAYHGGSVAISRVRDWRKEHPQYWRSRADTTDAASGATNLRAVLAEFFNRDSCDALQDSWPTQVVALVGIVAWLRGGALQDTIAVDVKEIMVAGNDLLRSLPAPASKATKQTSGVGH